MESIKELASGLMGIHLLDAQNDVYSNPSQTRKTIGLLLNIVIAGQVLSVFAFTIVMSLVVIFSGVWPIALIVFPIGFFAGGLISLFGWIIIDWEKNRLKSQFRR